MGVQGVYEAVLGLNRAAVAEHVRAAIDRGTDVSEILNHGLIAAMDEVGRRFTDGSLFVPEMLMAARAMKAGLDVVKPLLIQGDARPRGTVVIGTVEGDLHDIGKNLVAMMLEGAGFRVVDLGVDVGTDRFLAEAGAHGADLICLSALLTTTMPAMEETVRAVRERSPRYRTMVGGAPVTRAFAERIGADGYGEDAPTAVTLARRLVAA